MPRLDYDSLSILAAVIREGSFEGAAKSMNVTQSAVSQRIRQLEEKAGVVLVVRGRPCVPTPAGEQYFRHAEQVALLQQELTERLLGMTDGAVAEAVTVRIGVNNDSLATWFPAVIRRATHELNIRFDILPDDQEHTEASLRSGDALAIITSHGDTIQGCRKISLGSMNYVAVASPTFFAENFSEGVSLKTLEGSVCVAFNRKDTIQKQWMDLLFDGSVPVSTHYVPSYEGYIACCLGGAGWGLIPGIAATAYLARGELVELSAGDVVKVSLHWQAGMQSSKVLGRLGDLVLEVARLSLSPDSFRPE